MNKMAEYTGLRMRGFIKPSLRQYMKELMQDDLEWEDLYNYYPKEFSFLQNFIKLPNKNGVIFAPLSYMPSSWDEKSDYSPINISIPEFRREYVEKDGYIQFQCSIKDCGEIKEFLSNVVPYLFEDILYCEVYKEIESLGILYEYKQKKLEPIKEILYEN